MSDFQTEVINARLKVKEARANLYRCELSQVDMEYKRLSNIPGCYDIPNQICSFATEVGDSLTAITNLGKPEYLCSPSVTMTLTKKMPPLMKSRWHTYFFNSNPNVRHLGLMIIHEFLMHELESWNNYYSAPITNSHRKKGVQRPIGKNNKRKRNRAQVLKVASMGQNTSQLPAITKEKVTQVTENRSQMTAVVKQEPEVENSPQKTALKKIKIEPGLAIKKEKLDITEPTPVTIVCLRSLKMEKVDVEN